MIYCRGYLPQLTRKNYIDVTNGITYQMGKISGDIRKISSGYTG